MQANMGNADRIIRILVALGIAFLYFTDRISGTVATVLGVIAIVFLVTSTAARCPAYSIFGFSTRKDSSG